MPLANGGRKERCIRFAPRVREIDKQYEVNNNAELDNGVQHDFGEEEAKAKQVSEGSRDCDGCGRM